MFRTKKAVVGTIKTHPDYPEYRAESPTLLHPHFFDSFGEEYPTTEYPTLRIPTRIPYVGYSFKGGRVFVGYSYAWGILGRVFCRVLLWNSSLTATFAVESGCRYAKIDYCNLPSVFF